MYFASHSSDKQYFSSQKIDENVVFLATTHYKSGLTRRELPCVVTRNETLSGYRYCIPNSLILSFWILNLHIIISQFQKRSTKKHFFFSQSMLLPLVGAVDNIDFGSHRAFHSGHLHSESLSYLENMSKAWYRRGF